MRITEFEKLEEEPAKVELGAKFLSKELLKQKETKVIGDWITFYVITRVESTKAKLYEYTPAYEVLEEEVKK